MDDFIVACFHSIVKAAANRNNLRLFPGLCRPEVRHNPAGRDLPLSANAIRCNMFSDFKSNSKLLF